MKHRILFGLLASMALILALSGGGSPVSSQDGTQAADPQGPSNPDAALGTTITYQGHLIKNGSPVSGTCDLTFGLYDAASGGNYVADASATAQLSDGDFSAVLDFGADAFTGDGRWLQIYVRCPSGVGSYTQLSGRVALTAAPYAHSLRPGAMVIGSEGTTFHAANSAENGVAVHGEATSLSTASDYQAYGGKFTAQSRGGVGVYGEDKDSGDYSFGYGVYGKSNSTWGYGVYGENSSPDGYGVYSAGNAHIQGALSWQARTSYISISPAAFHPGSEMQMYLNSGNWLETDDTFASSFPFYAPVQLPHGATVTRMTFYWYDDTATRDATCTFYRDIPDSGVADPMAVAASTGASGYGFTEDGTIDFDEVNNYLYAYYLFDSDSLYLEIGVSDDGASCDGVDETYTIMEPRSQLQANAFAQRSRRVRTEENDDDYLVAVGNTGQGGAVFGRTDSVTDNARAGYFYAAATSGRTYGVYGRTDTTATDASAVYGEASQATGQVHGLYGRTNSAAGYGVYGSGPWVGVRGVGGAAASTWPTADVGLWGDSATGDGVWGFTDSSTDRSAGVQGQANAASGATFGVYGLNQSSLDRYQACCRQPASIASYCRWSTARTERLRPGPHKVRAPAVFFAPAPR